MYLQPKGVGSYSHPGNWTWEFYPPPYDFLAPLDSVPMPSPILGRSRGVGGCGCGGTCGGCGGGGHHPHGMGLFDSGLDLTGWGIPEWLTAAGGLYLLFSLFGDTKRAATGVRKYNRAAARKRREQLRSELAGL